MFCAFCAACAHLEMCHLPRPPAAMKLRVSMPFRMLSNATEAARAAAAAAYTEEVGYHLPPLPSQFSGAVGFAWLLLCVAAATVLLLLLLRAYLDNGGLIPLSGRYYARRWVAPKGATGARVQKMLQELCVESVGSLLPHPALHDLNALAKDKLVFVVFERRSGRPVMFHMAFRASYSQAVVLHLGLVVVAPAHQGRHLQRLCMLNMIAACLTYLTPRYVMTDIAASPSATKQVGDHMLDCFPNYRHVCSPEAGGAPQPWQLAVARFMMDYHRADFGTSADAVLDEATFVVRGSNAGPGGAAALTVHADKRRSRASRPNAFVEALLGPSADAGADELFHVGIASAPAFVAQALMLSCEPLRQAVMATHILRLMPALFAAVLGRPDRCMQRFRAFARRTGLSLQVAGAPGVAPGGCLWVCNHYSWLDYPVLQCASPRLLRVVARADLAKEGPFGAVAQRLLRALGVIEYSRGDKASGAAVRQALHAALVADAAPVLLFPEGTSQVEGPPKPFRAGGLLAAFAAGTPVQPVALRYSEPIGLAPETDALAGTAVMLNYPTQALVKFAPLLWPKDFASATDFAAAAEQAVRDAYAAISPAADAGHAKAEELASGHGKAE